MGFLFKNVLVYDAVYLEELISKGLCEIVEIFFSSDINPVLSVWNFCEIAAVLFNFAEQSLISGGNQEAVGT